MHLNRSQSILMLRIKQMIQQLFMKMIMIIFKLIPPDKRIMNNRMMLMSMQIHLIALYRTDLPEILTHDYDSKFCREIILSAVLVALLPQKIHRLYYMLTILFHGQKAAKQFQKTCKLFVQNAIQGKAIWFNALFRLKEPCSAKRLFF